jgi:site-specific recombinase XerD
MNDLNTLIQNYLEYCKFQKRLDEKTLKAYQIDLQQFSKNIYDKKIAEINSPILEIILQHFIHNISLKLLNVKLQH